MLSTRERMANVDVTSGAFPNSVRILSTQDTGFDLDMPFEFGLLRF